MDISKELNIDVKSPLLVATLRAISRHTGELAGELEIINNTLCPKCGDKLKAKRQHDCRSLVFCACPRCAYIGFHKQEFFDTSGFDKRSYGASGGVVSSNIVFNNVSSEDATKLMVDAMKNVGKMRQAIKGAGK